jgi:hypothetical protein
MLSDTRMIQLTNYEHEMACAEVYILFRHHPWGAYFQVGGLIVDRVLEINGKRFYIEMDMGTEKPEELYSKIERYRQSAGSGEKVLFVFHGKQKAENRLENVLGYCEEKRLGNFVWCAFYDHPDYGSLLSDPFGDVLSSPLLTSNFEAIAKS